MRSKLGIFSVVALAGLLVVAACSPDYVIRLPNGYFLAHVTSKENVIAEPAGRAVLGPTVEKYAVRGDVVVGSVAVNGERSWFILDTRHRGVRTMSHGDWKRELRTLGLDESVIASPSRLHSLMQR